MLQSICEKIFYYFDKNKQNEIKANLGKVIDNLGKYNVTPESIEKVKAILNSALSQSKQQPPTGSSAPVVGKAADNRTKVVGGKWVPVDQADPPPSLPPPPEY